MCPWAFQRTYALPDPFTLILQTYEVNHQNFDRAWEGLGGHIGGPNLVGYLLMGTHSHGIKCSLVRPNLQNRAHPTLYISSKFTPYRGQFWRPLDTKLVGQVAPNSSGRL